MVEIMLNMDLVIVEMATMTVYDFVKDGETKIEAETRGNKYYMEALERSKKNYSQYGDDYWKEQIETNSKKVEVGCRVMSFEDYQKAQREYLLDDDLMEITADVYEEMLCILPPLCLTEQNGVEMFCNREMYIGTYTNQYAHDKRTNKYYTKMVDAADRSTWISELLKEVA